MADIASLCHRIHDSSPTATVLISEILPRAQNLFPDCQHSVMFLDEWNWDAVEVNRELRHLADRMSWIRTICQQDFHTWLGPVRHMYGRDGLHLSPEGHDRLAANIEALVRKVSTSTTSSHTYSMLGKEWSYTNLSQTYASSTTTGQSYATPTSTSKGRCTTTTSTTTGQSYPTPMSTSTTTTSTSRSTTTTSTSKGRSTTTTSTSSDLPSAPSFSHCSTCQKTAATACEF